MSIQITADAPAERLQVTFNGSLVPLFSFAGGTTYNTLAGDMSAFAGSLGELRITALPVGFFGGFNRVHFDDIVFSTEAIPEPRVPALSVLGASLLGWLWPKRASEGSSAAELQPKWRAAFSRFTVEKSPGQPFRRVRSYAEAT
jgi:hypothetical protein